MHQSMNVDGRPVSYDIITQLKDQLIDADVNVENVWVSVGLVIKHL